MRCRVVSTGGMLALLGSLCLPACSAREKPTPAKEAAPAGDAGQAEPEAAEPAPRPTLAEPEDSNLASDPFSAADVEIDPEPPSDVPTVPESKVATAPVPARAFDAKTAPKARERFDEYVNVRALDTGPERIYFADMTGQDGKIFSKIRAVPLDGGEVELVRDGQGRIDALAVDEAGQAISWVAMPPEGGPPALWTAPLGENASAAEPEAADPRYGTANHLARLGDALFYVLPVSEQGRLGGIARVGVEGGAKTAIGRRLGPAFSPVSDGERLYFMAHQRDAPDVIYSVDAQGKDLRGHVAVPRGVVALAVDDRWIWWARIGQDGRSTEIGRVAKAAAGTDEGGAPEVVATVAEHVFETMVVAGGSVWLGTSAAEPTGLVVHLDPKSPEAAAVVFEAPRIWGVFGAGDRVFVHFERPGDDGQAHRVFAELVP